MGRNDPFSKSVLVIGHTWPEPDATAAGERTLWVVRGVLERGYKVTLASTASPGSHPVELNALGIECVPIRLNDPSFDNFLKDHKFDFVLFDRFVTEEQFSWRVRDVLPGARLLIDTQDLHSLRESRRKAHQKGVPWSRDLWISEPLFSREIASILRADLSLIISPREMELLLETLPLLKGLLHYLPFGLVPPPVIKTTPFDGRSDFVFVGNGKHRPNLDAITYLKGVLWPEIRKQLPGARLRVYGAYLPDQILQYHKPEEGFEVLGWVEDLETAYSKARIQLAPLRFGAGIKGKVLKAAEFGVPTVGTPVTFEGILNESEQVPFSAMDPQGLVDKAIHLYSDSERWGKSLKLQRNASEVHALTAFDLLYEALDATARGDGDLSDELRILQNLMRDEAFGRLRYLSRWIEAKEKRPD